MKSLLVVVRRPITAGRWEYFNECIFFAQKPQNNTETICENLCVLWQLISFYQLWVRRPTTVERVDKVFSIVFPSFFSY